MFCINIHIRYLAYILWAWESTNAVLSVTRVEPDQTRSFTFCDEYTLGTEVHFPNIKSATNEKPFPCLFDYIFFFLPFTFLFFLRNNIFIYFFLLFVAFPYSFPSSFVYIPWRRRQRRRIYRMDIWMKLPIYLLTLFVPVEPTI